ncbi:cupin domain-containing protein [Lentibacillus lipolyticus]|nr:cupin domain-containing protein [Lentibacillus lipolyticus]
MYNYPYMPPYPYNVNQPMHPADMQRGGLAYPGMADHSNYSQPVCGTYNGAFADFGRQPYTVNINQAAKHNNMYRTAIWTGEHLQVTLMSIPVGGDVGLEVHPDVDQFLRIEQGQGLVQMGDRRDRLSYQRHVGDDSAIMVPARTWHNVINTGHQPLKLYSIYAPPHHPFGTVHPTQDIAFAAEENH